ncbi:hypothetical protein JHN63_36745 [Streptomyces sp. MBT65]|uniref:hypothetical protein n=1 Tax=Streptomyces sp. MBT65 TaxID=1488395 RepID=UPI0019095912|nr:hypothetical protein [Streptomyces sp. MBT65]MBK3579255.1 hypothetical protein [Streptomyces sp. MBT65]
MIMSSFLRSRSALGSAAVTAVLAGATVAGAGAAYAAPGDSGNIDIRSVDWHSRGSDGVEVCEFVLVASNFESFPAVAWTITAQPPTIPPGDTLQSTLPLINGSAHSAKYLLPHGTYQLVWTTPSGPKQRRFAVDCRRHAQPARPEQQSRGPAAIVPGREYNKPTGGVPAGGGGVPDMENLSSESDSNAGTTTALTAGGIAVAALVMVRRASRRRARHDA